MEQKIFHRRNLPHIYLSNRIYFITYRLAGSLPAIVIKRLRSEVEEEKNKAQKVTQIINLGNNTPKFFVRYDELLDNAKNGIHYLSDPEIANICKNQFHYFDGKDYDLISYCIMSNHIHLVFSLKENARSVSKIMQSIKGYTAREANKILKREGKFWQDESFDRVVRDYEELKKIVNYVINNPVKVGLVKNWEDWKWTYCNFDYL